MLDEIKIGDLVRCFVAVGCDMRPMGTGIVTEIRSGYYMVDHMSHHGGAPWIYAERWIEKESDYRERETEKGEKE